MSSFLNSEIGYVFIVLAVIVLFIAFVYLIMYNGFIRKKNNVENSYSSIDVMLKKRHDLIPNLISVAKRYMNHEKDIFTEITKLRSQIVDNSSISNSEKVKLEDKLTNMLNTLKISIENYPNLKSDKHFLLIMKSFNEVEAQLSATRRTYNASVLVLNNAIEMFPTSIVAKKMEIEKADFFEATETEKKNVDFNQ